MTEKSLQPLPSGNILLVGVKASNFDEELKTHPRVIMWESQNEHWLTKEVPANVRAVFVTRFIGHNAFSNILNQARKRHITFFNPLGTGIITKQVKELLSISTPVEVIETKPETTVRETNQVTIHMIEKGKLKPLIPYIDFSVDNVQSAHALISKAKELGINTTIGSLAMLVGKERRKALGIAAPKKIRVKSTPVVKTPVEVKSKELDVTVQILNNMITELTDMREFLVKTVEENKQLRERMSYLKKALGE